MQRPEIIASTAIAAGCLGLGVLVGNAITDDNDPPAIRTTVETVFPDCDYETELFDGEECLSREDHEAHAGN